jgi:hypothetical protein
MKVQITLIAAGMLAMVSRATPSPAQCLGDFNGDFKVSVDELVTAVRNSLDDCEIAGARFVDDRDGTVTDRKTGLVWEQKGNLDGNANSDDPHDADNLLAWSNSGSAPDGDAFTVFLAALNGGTSPDGLATSGCFAGHCDWRLPTVEELSGIVEPTQGSCSQGSGPCTDPTLGPGQADGYWSATTFARKLSEAWLVDFAGGDTAHGGKTFAFFVRAVRGPQ